MVPTSGEICPFLCEGPGEGVLVPAVTGEAALSRPGEGAVRLNSDNTLLLSSSGDVAIETTGDGGVYRGAGVDTALRGSTDNLALSLSGVVVVSLSAVDRSEISSGVQVESCISGVEPLLKRSGRETLPLSSGKGDDA